MQPFFHRLTIRCAAQSEEIHATLIAVLGRCSRRCSGLRLPSKPVLLFGLRHIDRL